MLLDGRTKACICDFGLAEFQQTHVCHERRGKPLYMAPEMYTQTAFDGYQCDIWSLGVMLFVMITGCPPVTVAAVQDVRFQLLKACGVRHLIRVWDMKLPPAVIEILERLLVVEPENRMTVQELLVHPLITAPERSSLS